MGWKRFSRPARGFAGVIAVCVIVWANAAWADTITGPSYPPPGGVTFSSSGNFRTGTATWNYSNFNSAQYGQLWWGPATLSAIQIAFDGSADSAGETRLSFRFTGTPPSLRATPRCLPRQGTKRSIRGSLSCWTQATIRSTGAQALPKESTRRPLLTSWGITTFCLPPRPSSLRAEHFNPSTACLTARKPLDSRSYHLSVVDSFRRPLRRSRFRAPPGVAWH